MARPEHDLWAEQLARQLFPQTRALVVSRVPEGVSTWVYRIAHDDALFYLRVLPEENASFAPEVYVHAMLVARGLHVPEIVYFEHCNELFQRSLVVTTAIAGAPLAHDALPEKMASALRQAGRELAVINQLPVEGFGWIERTSAATDELHGEYATYAGWMGREINQSLSIFARYTLFAPTDLEILARQMEQAVEQFSDDVPLLAHGDFDKTHIFCFHEEYTGIIDFGEIRGANRLYDLGHFAIENAHSLPLLLQGYQEITLLPTNYEAQIQQAALLVAVNRTARLAARNKAPLAADRQVIKRALNPTFFT